ncbi:MAG: rhodanese-like domain-containing protein [Myxococcota bacterium]
MIKTIAILAAGGALALAFSMSRPAATVDGAQAQRLVEDGATLLDVRTPAEFNGGHIPGAVNIPVGELAERLSELGDRDVPVVVYCRSGQRSGRAQKMLLAEGFAKVENLGARTRWPQ